MFRCLSCGTQVRSDAQRCLVCTSHGSATVARTRAYVARRRDVRRSRIGSWRPSSWSGITIAILLLGSVVVLGAIWVPSSSARDQMQQATETTCLQLRQLGVERGDCPSDGRW